MKSNRLHLLLYFLLFMIGIDDAHGIENNKRTNFSTQRQQDIVEQLKSKEFRSYINTNSNYGILYPSCFHQDKFESNGNNYSFSMGDNISLTVCETLNETNKTLEEIYNEFNLDSIIYKRLKANWFVLSGYTDDDRIFYNKTVLQNKLIITAVLYYPPQYRDEMNHIIKEVFSKFPLSIKDNPNKNIDRNIIEGDTYDTDYKDTEDKEILYDQIDEAIVNYIESGIDNILDNEFSFFNIPFLIWDYITLNKEEKQESLANKFIENITIEGLEKVINEQIDLYNQSHKQKVLPINNLSNEDSASLFKELHKKIIDHEISKKTQQLMTLEILDSGLDIVFGLILLFISSFIANKLSKQLCGLNILETAVHKKIGNGGGWKNKLKHFATSVLAEGERKRIERAQKKARRIECSIDIALFIICYFLFTTSTERIENEVKQNIIENYSQLLASSNIGESIIIFNQQ